MDEDNDLVDPSNSHEESSRCVSALPQELPPSEDQADSSSSHGESARCVSALPEESPPSGNLTEPPEKQILNDNNLGKFDYANDESRMKQQEVPGESSPLSEDQTEPPEKEIPDDGYPGKFDYANDEIRMKQQEVPEESSPPSGDQTEPPEKQILNDDIPGEFDYTNDENRMKQQVTLDMFTILSECHLSLDTLLPKLNELILRFMEVEKSTIFLFDEKSNELYTRASEDSTMKEIRFPSDSGIAGSVFTSQQPLVIKNAYEDSRFNQDIDKQTGYHTKCILCTPIFKPEEDSDSDDSNGKLSPPLRTAIGVVQVLNKKSGIFEAIDQRMLEQMVMLTSHALMNTRLADENHRMRQVMNDISRAMAVSQDLEALLFALNQVFCSNLGVERCTLFLYDQRTNELYTKSSIDEGMSEIRFPADAGIAGNVFTSEESLIIPDAYADPRFNQEIDKQTGFRTRSILCTPIWDLDNRRRGSVENNRRLSASGAASGKSSVTGNNKVIVGVAQLVNKTQGNFTNFDLNLLENMTTQAAHALVSAHLSDQHTNLMQIMIEISKAMSVSQELDELLPSLTHIIMHYLAVERCTIFLYDSKSNELFARVSEDKALKEIRFPSNAGIAGNVCSSEEALIIDDAYSDSRFNQDIDRQTGFRTRSILCAPIWKTENGSKGKRTIIGVAQAINKTEGNFSENDLILLENMTTQAAHALVTASLTHEVLRVQKYNECVLESICDGIVSIDNDGTVVKVNKAAGKMLHLDNSQEIIGHDMEFVFSAENDWVLDAINWVFESGKTRTLQNMQLKVPHEASMNINATVSPLTDEDFQQIGCIVQIEDVTRERKLHGTLTRYMSENLAEELLRDDEHAGDAKLHNATALYSSIYAFNSITKGIGPTQTVELLNEYFERMTGCVFDHNGSLDKFIGDAIMANFGIPTNTLKDPDNAIQAAIQMQQELKKLNKERIENGDIPLKVGIGISTGEVVSGNIGSLKRMDYTAIGKAVNIALELNKTCKTYGADIVVSEFTVADARRRYTLRELDRIRVEGGHDGPVTIYEVLDHCLEDKDPGIISNGDELALYFEGLSCYRDQRFADAIDVFTKLHEVRPDDVVSGLYLERCKYFSETPPESDWDGVWENKSLDLESTAYANRSNQGSLSSFGKKVVKNQESRRSSFTGSLFGFLNQSSKSLKTEL